MTNLDSIFKSRDITLPTKIHLVKAIAFSVVMYGYESWTIKKAECHRIDAFELWCWGRLLSAEAEATIFWPLDEGERGEWKSWLKIQHSENEDYGIQSHRFMANRLENSENSDRLLFEAPKSLQMVTPAMKLKDACSLEEKLWPT